MGNMIMQQQVGGSFNAQYIFRQPKNEKLLIEFVGKNITDLNRLHCKCKCGLVMGTLQKWLENLGFECPTLTSASWLFSFSGTPKPRETADGFIWVGEFLYLLTQMHSPTQMEWNLTKN